MPNFSGTLRSNEIFAALFNMIISQQVFADNIKGEDLVSKARVDGSLFGDTKLYYSTDALHSKVWGNDSEATNLLAIHRPAAPECQAIVIDKFRQIELTIDNYLSKRAWMDEGSFGSFNSVMLGWLSETKKIYDGTLYNAYIGTAVGQSNRAAVDIDVTTAVGAATGLEAAKIEGMTIGEEVANIISDMTDYTRDFNDYGHIRRYDAGEIKIIWNSKFKNKLRKVSLPDIFNASGIVDKLDQEYLNSHYFGVVITSSNVATYSASTPTTGKPLTVTTGVYVPGTAHANGKVNSMVEKEVTVGGTKYHVFPGEEIPAGAAVVASGDFELGEVYIETSNVICKIYVKLPPFMSAFEVETSFFNAKSLTENHYLTFSHNTIEYLKAFPMTTVYKK